MINDNASPVRVVLYEGEGACALDDSERAAILRALLDAGYATTVTRSGGAGPAAAPEETTLVVIGCFDDGSPALEDAAGEVSITAHDISGKDAGQVLDAVEAARRDTPMNQPGSWKPWFPVIDYDRCTNCMQCLSFCLFDVYGVDAENRIQVQNNDNCKTNCPACSRVCPEVAIMFPKYSGGPINGAPVTEADSAREAMKVDISALLGGDIYSSLRRRSDSAKERFSKERDSNKALGERKKCLTKLAAAGDIPAEVLESLPSPEEIARRAEEAAARAKAALAESSAEG